ncbi:cysteine--tRNA ligase [Patescibacteria group bacterium]
MKIYNTLTGKKEEFIPQNKDEITFYLCGPTVYDYGHIGNGRSATSFDIIRRYLIYRGYNVKYASNYTDIDDKMINRANEKGISVKELADTVIKYFEKDYADLKIMDPDIQPKATEHIKDIVEIIKKLDEKGATYELEDGIYFDISKFPEYGKLSKQKIDELQMGARVKVNDNKKNPQDFALWKKEKPGEPSWDSPWGKGRPGWHIECSGMNKSLFGETIDIHAGGVDLVFPHHECEIAQSEMAHGKPFSKYWLHNGYVNINGEKMSKSLGNFITLKDALEKINGFVLRYLFAQAHYRAPIHFSDDLVEQAQKSLERIHDFVRNIKSVSNEGELSQEVKVIVETSKKKFEEGMDDDFETSEGLAAIFGLIKDINVYTEKTQLTTNDKAYILEYLELINEIFAFIIPEEQKLSDELMALIKQREEVRESKDWEASDRLRDELKQKGILVEDTPKGTIWKNI